MAAYLSEVPEFPSTLNDLFSQLGVNLAAMPNTLYGTTVQIQQAIWDGGLIKRDRGCQSRKRVSRRAGSRKVRPHRTGQSALFRFAAASGEYRHRRPDDRRPAAQLQDARIHGGIRHGRKERPRHAEGGDTRRPAAACTARLHAHGLHRHAEHHDGTRTDCCHRTRKTCARRHTGRRREPKARIRAARRTGRPARCAAQGGTGRASCRR